MRKNMLQCTKEKLDMGRQPEYISRLGKPLWVDESHYDSYSQVTGSKILRGADGRFWGYSDNPNAVIFDGIMEVIK